MEHSERSIHVLTVLHPSRNPREQYKFLYRNVAFLTAEIIMNILQGCQSTPPAKGERNKQDPSSRLVPLHLSAVSFAPSLTCPRLNYSPIKHLHKVSYLLGTMTSTEMSHRGKWLCVDILGAGIKWHAQEKLSDRSHTIKGSIP